MIAIALVLDPRWPTQFPCDALGALGRRFGGQTGPVPRVFYTEEVPVSVRWVLGDLLGEVSSTVDLEQADMVVTTDAFSPILPRVEEEGASLYRADSLADPVWRARQIMARAVQIGEWEQNQTHRSLLPYLEEEAAEFAEAVVHDAPSPELVRELSDLFLQVLFHAEIAEDFDLDAVSEAFCAKLRARAPYLFDPSVTGTVGVEEQERLWQLGKQQEASESL